MNDKNQQHITIDDVRQYAAKHGVNVGKGDYTAAATNAAKVLEDKQAAYNTAAKERGRVQRLLDVTPDIVSAIDNLSLVAFKLLQGLFSTLGLALVLIAVVAVEIGRVQHGVAMFETSAAAAFAAAFVIVMLNLMLEFLIHFVEHRAGWVEEKRHAFSLRLVWQRLAYMLGFSQHWTPREKSPAAGLRSFQLLLSFGILWLALMGSVGGMLDPALVWHVALTSVFLHSQAAAFTVWMNGLIVSALLVFGSQRLTAYIAQKAAERIPTTQAASFDAAAYHEAAYAQELLARVKAKIAAKQGNTPDDTAMPHETPQNALQGHTAPDFLATNGNGAGYTNGRD